MRKDGWGHMVCIAAERKREKQRARERARAEPRMVGIGGYEGRGKR